MIWKGTSTSTETLKELNSALSESDKLPISSSKIQKKPKVLLPTNGPTSSRRTASESTPQKTTKIQERKEHCTVRKSAIFPKTPLDSTSKALLNIKEERPVSSLGILSSMKDQDM